MKNLLAIALVALLASTAVAGPKSSEIHLGDPDYGGSGCPDGTVSAVLSDDAQQLSVFFDEYIAETSGADLDDRKSCSVGVPVHVPQGLSVSLLAIDYRGFASIPKKGEGTFAVEYFFAGKKGPKSNTTFKGGYDDDFLVEDDLLVLAQIWSPCGTDVILRSNSSLRARKAKKSDPDAYMALDSADFSASMLYHLKWKSCF